MASDDWKHRAGAGPRPGRPGVTPKGKGRARLAVAVFPLLVAGGVAVGLPFLIRDKPAPLLLSLPVYEYEAWPANAFARQDAEGLREALPKPDRGVVATQSQEQIDGFEREVEQLADRAKANRGQPLIIHLCALAVADGDTVYVLPAKAVPGRKESWLPLERVIEAVGKLAADRLLLLDLRPVADPRLGQTGAELAKALDKQLSAAEQAKKLPYLVGAFCAPAEYPYVSPELGRGVFAEFLRRGLDGHADTFNADRQTDDRVSAVELVTYARARVVQWLRKHDVPLAAPVLYGTGSDFVLRDVPQGAPPWAAPAPAPAATLADAWKTVDDWRDAGAVHKTPRTFRELQETVAFVTRGEAGGRDVETLGQYLARRQKRLQAVRAKLEPAPYPVATVGRLQRQARTGAPAPPPPAEAKGPEAKAKGPDIATEIDKLKAAFKVFHRSAGTKDKPADPKVLEGAKAAVGKAQMAYWTAPPEAPPYDRTVLDLFHDLMSSDGTERTTETLAQYRVTLRGLPNPPGHLELAYLALVSDPDIEHRRFWPEPLPRFLLTAADAGEDAVAVSGRGLLRMSTRLKAPDQKFADSLEGLFVPRETRWKQAANDLDGLAPVYREVGTIGAAYEAAVAEWEEGVALLAAVGDFSPPGRTTVDDAVGLLKDTVGKLRAAIDAKPPPANQPDPTDGLTNATAEARGARSGLAKALGPTPGESAVEGRARLKLAVWRAEDRRQWTADADTAALARATEALAEAVSPEGDVRKPIADAGFQRAADRRVARATALLALVGEPPPDTPAGWRAALADRLDARYTAAEKESDLDRAVARERFAWLIHPADLPAAPEGGGWNDPGADVRLETDRRAARWLIDNRYNPVIAKMAQAEGNPQAARDLARDLRDVVKRLTSWPPRPDQKTLTVGK